MSEGFKILRQGKRKHDEKVHFVPRNWTYNEQQEVEEGSGFNKKQKSAPNRCPICGTESDIYVPSIIREAGQWKCTVCEYCWTK